MNECPDELLITFIREGNKEAYRFLKLRYDKLVYKWINEKKNIIYVNKLEIEDIYYLIWSKFDGIIDEYESHLGFFRAYFKICVERIIIKCVRELNYNNRKALTTAVSLDSSIQDSEGLTYIDTIESKYLINEMEENYHFKSKQEKFCDILSKLSKEERMVVKLKKEGKSYKEIASCLGINEKRVDYILYKLKKKLTNC